jgi:hypothetical protein
MKLPSQLQAVLTIALILSTVLYPLAASRQ